MKKYVQYFKERFPFSTHLPIILIFSFSAICYSLLARGASDFVSWDKYFVSLFLCLSLFLLLRISDEFKDNEDDLKYRKYLPVPRGLVSLKDLGKLGVLIIIFQLIIIYFYSNQFEIYIITMVYLFFMYHEFFIAKWLKKYQLFYVISHMFIIPIVDLVASSAHWAYDGLGFSNTLIYFFIVSFFNGIILEVGRKIKTPEMEEEGVVSYTSLLGMKKATLLWLGLLFTTFLLACLAAFKINSPIWVYYLLSLFFVICSYFGFSFLKKPSLKGAKNIEHSSGIWTMGMYLNLGALPFVISNWI